MSDSITVYLSGDAWNGNAAATLLVNGVPVGGILNVQAVNAADDVQAFTVKGNFGVAPVVSLSFVNDASDGTAADDRNLYLDGFLYNGVPQLGVKTELSYDQTLAYTLASTPPAAERASDFLTSLGVDVHLDFWNTSYGLPNGQGGNTALVASSLAYLGIHTIRIGIPTADTLVEMQTLAADGIKFDVLMPSASSTALLPSQISAIDSLAGSVVAIEGPNETNLTTDFSWNNQTGDVAAASYQKALYTAVKADPTLSHTSVYNLTLGGVGLPAYQGLGDLSASTTDGNVHVYFQNGLPPASTIQYALSLANASTPTNPTVITETNYTSAPGIKGSVSLDVQARYDLDLLMDATKDGVQATFVYELLDEQTDPNQTNNEDHYGLFNADGSPKEAATAIHNLTSILADNTTAAGTFQTGALGYTVAGMPASGDSLVLEKSNGAFDIVLWAEPEIWNVATSTQIAAPIRQVTVTLGNQVSQIMVYDPLSGTTPIATYAATSTVTVSLTDHPVVIEVTPGGSASPVACYAKGTGINTAEGEIVVEHLSVGMRVQSAFGGTVPIVWIGHRHIDCMRHPRPWDVWPVRVLAHAFGNRLPHRDLMLSPDHSVYVDNILIPVRQLINDVTIRQEKVARVSYWHVELPVHDVIMAEGLPVESYLDTGNRDSFANAQVSAAHPDLSIQDWNAWASLACASLVEDGPRVMLVRHALARRAEALGHRFPDTFTVTLDSKGSAYVTLPPDTERVRLVSPAVRKPGESRRLGVAVSSIKVDSCDISLHGSELSAGFHAFENEDGAQWRWTNGDALLLLSPSNTPISLEIAVVMVAHKELARAA